MGRWTLHLLATLALLSALVLAACGDDEDGGGAGDVTIEAPVETAVPTGEGADKTGTGIGKIPKPTKGQLPQPTASQQQQIARCVQEAQGEPDKLAACNELLD